MLTAVVPVRKGSRRLKNKNIAPFGTSNLLSHKIEQLKRVPSIDSIVVSSDSEEMLEMAQSLGVSAHHRATEYCDEESKSFGEVVRHIAESVTGEHVLWATCTSPLVQPEDYSDAIECYFMSLKQGYDSLVSFEEVKRYFWDEKGPLNYKLGAEHVPSQDLPPLHRVTDGILIATRSNMIEWQYFHGHKPFRYIMDKRKSIDIDDVLDLECARAWLHLS